MSSSHINREADQQSVERVAYIHAFHDSKDYSHVFSSFVSLGMCDLGATPKCEGQCPLRIDNIAYTSQ